MTTGAGLAGKPARILIVDDSAVMRSLLRYVVCSEPGLEVVGTAADGAAGLAGFKDLRPDLVLLDVEMPVMDGLAALSELRRRDSKTPVIMCSSLTQRGAAVTVEALTRGASDYVAKPSGQANRDEAMRALAHDLIPKIRALLHSSPAHSQPGLAARPHLVGGSVPVSAVQPHAELVRGPLPATPPSFTPTVVAIGVSTGGPAALDLMLSALPAHFPLPILVVQHMPELFTQVFAERLNSRCALPVREAAEGDFISPGCVFIARGNWHLEALPARPGTPPALHLSQGPLENYCRPSADVLFRSVARAYGCGALALVLTGMGSDGRNGCRAVREMGGVVWAQDEASSTVWGMPGAVAQAGLAQKLLPLAAIAPELVRMAGRQTAAAADSLPRQSNRARA